MIYERLLDRKGPRRLAKTGTYWVCHITVAVTIAYLLTGNIAAALGIGFIEPTVQAVVFWVHEWVWERGRNEPVA
jgi:uncharacterized membrane protein